MTVQSPNASPRPRAHANLLIVGTLAVAVAGVGCRPDSQVSGGVLLESGRDSVLIDDWPVAQVPSRDAAFTYAADGEASSPLFRVRGLVPRPGGGVYVANAGSYEVLAVDQNGSVEWSIGRRGDGPAEFQSVGRLQPWRGDTLIAIDQARSTAAFWTASGSHIQTKAAPIANPEPVSQPRLVSGDTYSWSQPWLFGVDTNNRFVLQGPERVVLEGTAGRREIRVPIMVVDADGVATTLVELHGGWVYEPGTPAALPIAGYAPLSSPLAVAVHPDGLVWARGDRNEIVQFDHDGQVTRVFTVRQQLQEVTSSLRRSYLETSGYRTWYPVNEDIPFPDTVPAFDRVFVAEGLAIWARRFSWGNAQEDWVYFTDAPAAVSRVRFPERVRIMTATADAAYGVWRDELDVEHLVRFRLPHRVTP